MSRKNQVSVSGIVASLVVGALVIAAGSDGSAEVGSVAVFAICGVVSYVINWVVFVPSNRAQTERYFDLTGSLTYLTLVGLAVVFSADLDARGVIVAVMVAVWAVRLGSFLFRRVRRDGRDGRFDRIKTDPLRFLMSWTLQGLWVLLTAACALAVITSADREPIEWVAVVGIGVWVVGFVIEVVADQQKSAFRRVDANKGRYISTGLWAWSRHPNYFGEIMLWTGVAIMAVPVLSGWRWAMLISPVFVVILLTRISGVPLLEARAQKRWGGDDDYQAYRDATPSLIPRPPRR
ncbi:MAG TPA: DUF1295 domain-containing protein [Acidimicrobiales bacterium]|nr:DUF1295 domain-containing protein [Acidimicrobiales bacterium]